MVITTYAGLLVALLSIISAIYLEGSAIGSFFKLSALTLIIGGTLGATVASFSVSQILTMVNVLRIILERNSKIDLAELFLRLLEKTRREGLLSLEDDIDTIDDELIRKGLRLIVDGSDPNTVEEILFEWADERQEAEIFSAKIIETAGGFSPTIGIIGTVMGLVHVLENLGAGTAALGQGIATAFIATFYGIGFANLLFLPIANKVKAYSKHENEKRHAIIRGLLSIQSGDNKRIMIERMMPFLDN